MRFLLYKLKPTKLSVALPLALQGNNGREEMKEEQTLHAMRPSLLTVYTRPQTDHRRTTDGTRQQRAYLFKPLNGFG